ncbi:MAG: rRNA maturation RNase YbeY [Bordetella sp.]|nr:MAG: rRNA maturation RNase YbeY [Bordetella sp.]
MNQFFLKIEFNINEKLGLFRWRFQNWIKKTLEIAKNDSSNFPQKLELCLRLVGIRESHMLNYQFRNCDYPTNVLTFEYGLNQFGKTCSDIIICVPILKLEANEQGKSLLHHAAHLTIHGTLHSIGYNHIKQKEAAQMEALETKIMIKMNMPNPYI